MLHSSIVQSHFITQKLDRTTAKMEQPLSMQCANAATEDVFLIAHCTCTARGASGVIPQLRELL
jgi:hypothetical protein